MDMKMQNLIKLSLDLHKLLLDMEKEAYERKNGAISNNNEYFSLVVNHEDFKWLRPLSEIIAAIDEETESEEINGKRAGDLLKNLSGLISASDKSDFSLRYQDALEKNEALCSQDERVKAELDKIINSLK